MARGRWGGREKVIAPFTQRSRSMEEVERGSVCVCEREREREKVNTWVSGNLRSGKGFAWVTIAIGSGAGIVIDWGN